MGIPGMRSKAAVASVCMLLSFGVSSDAMAQPYPGRAIRFVVPFAPAGATDISARIMSQKLAENLGVPVVVDNRPGASSMLGTDIVAKGTPDGYTLVIVTSEFSINPSLQPKIPYDALKDFTPISQTASLMFVLSAHPSLPVKSVKEFIALAKARPGQLTYGSTGSGSITHLAGVLFQNLTGTTLVHVPFKGGGPATVALLGNEINFMFSGTGSAVEQIRSGRLRAIAVTGSQRFSEIADVPTFVEAGVPGLELTSWSGVLSPAGTRPDIVNKLNSGIVAAVRHPAVRERFASLGIQSVGSSPKEFALFLRADIEKWTKAVIASGARAD